MTQSASLGSRPLGAGWRRWRSSCKGRTFPTALLARLGVEPGSVLEPTCGRGTFIDAASRTFPRAKRFVGVDINETHLDVARGLSARVPHLDLKHGDFFSIDWTSILQEGVDPWLIIGNPPWVTNADLGSFGSENLPKKSNFQGRTGIDAITGKSNFDISEWMLLQYLRWLDGRDGTIAILCKTTVARKILLHVWRGQYPVASTKIYHIDALTHFGVSVDACLFVLETRSKKSSCECPIFSSLEDIEPTRTICFAGGHLILDADAFERRRMFVGKDLHYVWRSGIKHDCAKLMELDRTPQGYVYGLGELSPRWP